jgi:hypothetical protein
MSTPHMPLFQIGVTFFEYAAWIYYFGMSAMCGWKMMMTPLQMAGVFVPHNKFIYFIPCSLGSSPEA